MHGRYGVRDVISRDLSLNPTYYNIRSDKFAQLISNKLLKEPYDSFFFVFKSSPHNQITLIRTCEDHALMVFGAACTSTLKENQHA